MDLLIICFVLYSFFGALIIMLWSALFLSLSLSSFLPLSSLTFFPPYSLPFISFLSSYRFSSQFSSYLTPRLQAKQMEEELTQREETFKDILSSLSKCVRVEVHGMEELQELLRSIQKDEEGEVTISLSLSLSLSLAHFALSLSHLHLYSSVLS